MFLAVLMGSQPVLPVLAESMEEVTEESSSLAPERVEEENETERERTEWAERSECDAVYCCASVACRVTSVGHPAEHFSADYGSAVSESAGNRCGTIRANTKGTECGRILRANLITLSRC